MNESNFRHRGKLARDFIYSSSLRINVLLNDLIDSKIKELGSIDSTFEKMLIHFKELSQGGKKFRGGLVKLGYLASGGSATEEIYYPGAAIEIFQTGILVHDDISDKASRRRGVPTIHEVFESEYDSSYGFDMAMYAGDFSFYFSYEVLLNSKFPKDLIIKACDVYSKYTQSIVAGQVMDVSASKMKMDVDDVFIKKVYKYKTSQYTGVLPLLLGYELAGSSDADVREALIKYGECLGLIYQIQDDILDIFGDEINTGKILGRDITEGKNTLLSKYALTSGDHAHVSELKELFGKNLTETDILKAREIMVQTGSLEKVKKIVDENRELALKQINNITSISEISSILESLIDYVYYRNL
ncbi:MAG: geranylgeranyl pyrophosphate synthase [Patescibacteria group bacterium]|nr:MAG: geranylgeranyl pyrophosphate synthase [Patescibacteria group bacterium]